jgi:chemotaxis protein CheD
MNTPMNPKAIEKCIPGFENIKRHYSEVHKSVMAIIEPGQLYVSRSNEMIMTTLGSCIAACIRDPQSGIGGMNHFMLPMKGNIYEDKAHHVSGAMRYGNWAMEHLINQVLKGGAKRRNLEIKIFGAGGSFETRSVCELNIKFVTEYLHDENLKVAVKDLGGPHPRTIVYNVQSGKILMKYLTTKPKELVDAELSYGRTIDKSQEGNDVQLF